MKTDPLKFTDAETSCESFGGRLAEPRNQEQFDALAAFSTQANIFWLGATDLLQEGLWLWSSDNTTVDLELFWNHNEPNNQGSSGEQCLQFRNSGLNDDGCNARFPYACEFAGIGNITLCS